MKHKKEHKLLFFCITEGVVAVYVSMATTPIPDANDISTQIQSVILTKNPIALFFGLSKLRVLFEDLADNLLSNIEKTYYEESTGTFVDLIKEYERQGFYKIMTAYYYDIGYFAIQKQELDKYFEESYWRDVDFYFYVLMKHPEIKTKVSILHDIYVNDLDEEYLQADESEKIVILESLAIKNNLSIGDYSGMPAFTAFFKALIPELLHLRNSGLYNATSYKGYSHLRFIKEIYMLSISENSPIMLNFWRTYFIDNSAINRNLIDVLDDRETLECFNYLRDKLLTNTKYNLSLSDSSKYRTIINDCILLQNADVSQKMNFLGSVHLSMGKRTAYREQSQNILRKGLLYQNSIDLVDAILGITFLKRVIFYEVRRRMVKVDVSKYQFETLDQVTMLVKMLESSIILRFFRPFFIYRLSQVFNKKTELYYFIKFVLTIHSSTTYNDYQELSRFFVSLEAFEKQGWYGALLKTAQFGWVIIAIVIASMIAPFGVFLAGAVYGIGKFITRVIKVRFPELALTSNFQF